MSDKITTLQDTNFYVEINFLSVDRDTGNSTYLPIDLSSVTFFEIRDDLINFGLTGNLTFPNWGQLLDKLPAVGKKGKETHTGNTENFITISIKDKDIDDTEAADYDDNGYHFLASAKSSSSLLNSAVNVKQTVDFEEDVTSLLKKISWEDFLETRKTDYAKIRATNLADNLISVINTIHPDTAQLTEEADALNLGGPSTPCGNLNIFGGSQGGSSKSLYAVIQDGYNHLIFHTLIDGFVKDIESDAGSYNYSLPLLKTREVERALEQGYSPDTPSIRKVILSELLTKKHIEFITFYKRATNKDKTSKNKPDFSSVYMEEFALAPSDATDSSGEVSADSGMHNVVEQYDLVQPDINNLRQTIWGNYEIITSDPDQQTTNKIRFNKVVTDFEVSLLGGHKSNLPMIPFGESKTFKIENLVRSDISTNLTLAKFQNVICKSFIFLNETIVLNVKGKMYRKPGKFISIKGDLCPTPARELWFVIEVKHKFENGSYRNEIKAVRFLDDGYVVPPRGYLDSLPGPLPGSAPRFDDLGIGGDGQMEEMEEGFVPGRDGRTMLPTKPPEEEGLTDEEKDEARKKGADVTRKLLDGIKEFWNNNFSPPTPPS